MSYNTRAGLGIDFNLNRMFAKSAWDEDNRSRYFNPQVEDLLVKGADGIDILYICDAMFSERTKDPAIVANLRKAKKLIVTRIDEPGGTPQVPCLLDEAFDGIECLVVQRFPAVSESMGIKRIVFREAKAPERDM